MTPCACKRILRALFIIRGLAESGRFDLHPHHDAEGCKPMAEATFAAIEYIAQAEIDQMDTSPACTLEAGPGEGEIE